MRMGALVILRRLLEYGRELMILITRIQSEHISIMVVVGLLTSLPRIYLFESEGIL